MFPFLAAAVSIAAGPEPRQLHYPAIAGKNVVFTYAGDLWLTTTEPGASARRLTTSPGTERNARISPDGTKIAFVGAYDGNVDVYVMPLEGGEPTRLTFESTAETVVGWTPDGRIAYTSTYGNATDRDTRLWLIDPKGGLPQRTPLTQVDQVSFFADGQTVAYQRVGSQNFNWRKYRGGTQGRISLYNLATNAYSELPSRREQSYYPMAVGRSVYYISDKDGGTLNLYRYDLDSRKETALTRFADADIRRASTDGASIVFERDGYLWRYDISRNTTAKLTPKLLGDNPRARPALRSLSTNLSDVAVTPGGVRVVVEARGELFSVPVDGGDTRNLTRTPDARERFPTLSPDGATLAYLSDATGEVELYTRPTKGGDATRVTSTGLRNVSGLTFSPDGKTLVTTARNGDIHLVDLAARTVKTITTNRTQSANFAFSPDSKWLALVKSGKNLMGSVWFYEMATGSMRQVTDGLYDDQAVAFDLDGKFLYVVSDRTFRQTGDSEGAIRLTVENASRVYALALQASTPNPLVKPDKDEPEPAKPDEKKPEEKKPETPAIDFDGLGARAVPLPWPAGRFVGLIGAKGGVFALTPTGLLKYDLASQQAQTIFASVPDAFSFNAARTKVAWLSRGQVGVNDVRPNIALAPGNVDLAAVEAIVDPRAEWKQIFWEAWRWVRDNYYDPGMRGLDWNAVGKRYAAYLDDASHRSDLNETIGLMIGELGTGHSYVGGGDPGPGVRIIPTGMLGADYVADQGKVRFQRIYRGFNFDEARRGPLGDPGVSVKEGDYLLAIDGNPVDASVNPSSLLVNKVGRSVTLTVNDKPTIDGARTVRVRPIGDETTLRYAEWVESRRKLVETLSGGRIGYLHIPDTSEGGAEGFVRGFFSQTDKDALILDERDNGGGNLPWFFIEKLQRQPVTRLQNRNGPDMDQAPLFAGPKVMLINENAGSGGDMLPYLFRKAGLGPLIGTRTWGGLVGIGGSAPLVDGGFLTAPEFAIYDPDTQEIIAENQGIDPDIAIDNRPDLVAAGKDPQLEKAVETLLEQLKKTPPRKVRTQFPRLGKNARP